MSPGSDISSEAAAAVQRVLDSQFELHTDESGATTNWALSQDALRLLARNVATDDTSAETGCGVSTLIFGALRMQHHCFTLLPLETDRILREARALDIPMDRVQFHHGDSAYTLPNADLPELSRVLIDGAHAYPYPSLDWFYLTRKLRVGGLLGIDDIWMPSVGILIEFLDREPGWEKTAADSQTAWYVRREPVATRHSLFPDAWDHQGLNARQAESVRAGREFSRLSNTGKVTRHPVQSSRLIARKLASRYAGRRRYG